jgi:magnesium-transporting ATPase (P-type)
MIRKDEEVPADLLLMHSSNESGIVSVDTMALDGETNLKEKVAAIDEMNRNMNLSQMCLKMHGSVICDQPNENIEHWEGLLKINNRLQKTVACSIKNLLVRGSVLRNTEYAIGIVIYTGSETKIFMNSKNPPHKVSNLMKKMNKMLL